MNWKTKLAALRELDPRARVVRRDRGDFYVADWSVERTSDVSSILEGFYSTGKTPAQAVNCLWMQAVGLAPHEYLVVDAMRPTRQHLRWCGRWATSPIRKALVA